VGKDKWREKEVNFFGKSMVTEAEISFHLHEDQI